MLTANFNKKSEIFRKFQKFFEKFLEISENVTFLTFLIHCC